MEFVDSHCHIHDSEFYPDDREEVYRASRDAGVTMVCIGTDIRSSQEAVEFSQSHPGCYPVIGIHPHEAKNGTIQSLRELVAAHKDVIVGIGEIGLDYFYEHSSREVQAQLLREQIQLALEFDLPISFHVREAYEDFWHIFDEFRGIRGVLHSFTDTQLNADKAIERGLLIGVNGISTFTKIPEQQEMYARLPLSNMLLETDAPFLTPRPLRGRINSPAYVGSVAEHQSEAKHLLVDEVARVTTQNARELFGI